MSRQHRSTFGPVFPGVTRRAFLERAAAVAPALWLCGGARAGTTSTPAASFPSDPFSVGVASGDPAADSVVLWTRLAPEPLEPGGGLPPQNIEVAWELADDEAMKHVVQKGVAVATPQLGHSVHVEPRGLEADRWYWYRFRAGDAESRIGRTRTLPAADAAPPELRLAYASCQNFESGLYTAYEHMAKDELDLVIHLGDYIYEHGAHNGLVRKHANEEPKTLDAYRIRHAQYKTDRHLQTMHASCPWVVVWDDHEVNNNYACDMCQRTEVDPVDFLVRRAAAYQAYYEMMPLRRTAVPQGPRMQLYRKLSYGRLAEILALDTRQYRTDQPNNDEKHDLNADALSPANSILGARQREWMESALSESPAAWNVLAQQVMMGMVDFDRGKDHEYSMDHWTGYAHERMGFARFLQERRVPNVVVLTGDIHSNWVNDLRIDDRREEGPIVATEFVGTSISSSGNGVDKPKRLDDLLRENPCVRYHNAERGYVRATVTPQEWRCDFRTIEDITKPGAPCFTRASFALEAGRAGVQRSTT